MLSEDEIETMIGDINDSWVLALQSAGVDAAIRFVMVSIPLA